MNYYKSHKPKKETYYLVETQSHKLKFFADQVDEDTLYISSYYYKKILQFLHECSEDAVVTDRNLQSTTYYSFLVWDTAKREFLSLI